MRGQNVLLFKKIRRYVPRLIIYVMAGHPGIWGRCHCLQTIRHPT